MERAAFVLPIRPDKVDDYRVAHEQVWPEMRDAISASGIRNYTIFQQGTLAFGYLEADDVQAAFRALNATEVNTRWQDAMADLLEVRVDDSGPEAITEVFHLD